MSSVNYSLNHKGVRLISSEEAWIKGKNGKRRLNPKYNFVGKIKVHLQGLRLLVLRSLISKNK